VLQGALVDIQGRVIAIPTLGATDPQLGGGSALRRGFRRCVLFDRFE